MVVTNQAPLVFRIDPKLLQHRPPRLLLATTLSTLGNRIETGELDANLIVDILDENRLLPYIIRNLKNLNSLTLGQLTNASKIGDIVVSEECIRGKYELCLAFLKFVLIVLKTPSYVDTTNTILASVTYITNEIYPNYHIWTYRSISDMHAILSYCTQIFHQIIVNSKNNQDLSTSFNQKESQKKQEEQTKDLSHMEIVCIISLSQYQAHKQLLDVIVEGKKLLEKIKSTDEQITDGDMILTYIRQSLMLFDRLLNCCRQVKSYLAQQGTTDQPYKEAGDSNQNMTSIEKALFDTTIRPALLQHLFSYVYHRDDSETACLAATLIKKIAEKFSMSLMACLGSEADKACEFFINYLGGESSNTELEIAIIDLLSTCVRHQPGLIELFLNYKRDTDKDASATGKQTLTFQVIMNLLKKSREQNDNTHRLLCTHVMRFILTFWQKSHSAIEQFDKLDEFWDLVTYPLFRFSELDMKEIIGPQPNYALAQSLNDRLNSYVLMILARELFSTNSGIIERKLNAKLLDNLNDLNNKNIMSKYSSFVMKRYSCIVSNLDKSDDYNRILVAWRDFLASYSKFKPFEISQQCQTQIVNDLLACLTNELKLAESLNKERIATISDTLLLIWVKWMTKNSTNDEVFRSVHELLYLADVSKEYLPFSFLLTFQSTLNLYLVRNRDSLISNTRRSFDLLVPALQMMHFSLRIMDQYVCNNLHHNHHHHHHQHARTKQATLVAPNSTTTTTTTTKGATATTTTTTTAAAAAASEKATVVATTTTTSSSSSNSHYKPGIELRLCQASVNTFRFIIDIARPHVQLWASYMHSNLRSDSIVHSLTILINKRIGFELSLAIVDLLLCLATIEETADYLNKSTLLNLVNMISVSPDEQRLLDGERILPSLLLVRSHCERELATS